MSIEVSPEIEARLVEEAQLLGISVETLLTRLINDHAVLEQPAQLRPDLPVWYLGAVGPLRRRAIYDDVR